MRLGLAGGGSDVSPYSDLYGGLVLNATINLYAYCTIEETSDGNITINSYDAHCQQTLTSAKAYTDMKMASWDDAFDKYKNDVDRRLSSQDRQIARMGAMSGAYAGMAMNTAGLSGANRVGVGFGSQGGETAIAVGYQHSFDGKASVSIGGSAAGGETSLTAGAGFSW